jgi:nucleoside-diphosphate-sugar epimerase
VNKPTILITGSDGFIGKWAVLFFKIQGFIVIAKSRKGVRIYDELKNKDKSNKTHIYTYKYIIDKYKPNVIIHLAANSNIADSNDYYSYINDNSIQVSLLLNQIKNSQLECKFFYISTASLYGLDNFYKREIDPLQLNNGYVISKYLGEQICQSYAHSFEIFKKNNLFIIRSCNIIGGGDNNNQRIFPHLINSILKKYIHQEPKSN